MRYELCGTAIGCNIYALYQVFEIYGFYRSKHVILNGIYLGVLTVYIIIITCHTCRVYQN